MAGRVKDIITPDVRNLIKQLTGFTEHEENFQLCDTFAVSNLLYHRFLSVDSHAVRRSITGVVTKFMIHGHLDVSRRLDQLVNKFLCSEVFTRHTQYDIQWSLLSLLLNLSNNPTTHPQLKSSQALRGDPLKEEFDWSLYTEMCALLHEGSEEFRIDYNEDSNSDEFNDLSDVEESVKTEQHKISALIEVPIREERTAQKSYNKEKCKECINRGLSAEKWLKENVQHSWWNDDEITQRCSSRISSVNMAQRWDNFSAVPGVVGKTTTVSEYKVIREILWMLQEPTSTFIFEEENGKFKLRLGLTIPSLTKDAIKNYLNHLCLYFNMIHEMKKLRNELYPAERPVLDCALERSIPHTFEAYMAAVDEFLSELQEVCIRIETTVRKQEEIYTLYALSMELEPKLLELRSMYSVHVVAVRGWKDSDNWLAASRLLSVLYSGAMASSRDGQPSIMLKLFLKSFRPYLDIINIWLTSGRLEDWTSEFIITKNREVAVMSQDLWEEDFLVHPYAKLLAESNIEALPLLKVVERKVLHAGKSMELLHRLDRLAEIVSQCESQGCLYTEFLENLHQELSLFVSGQDSKTGEKVQSQTIVAVSDVSLSKKCELLEDDITDQLKHLDDPFLMKALEEYIPFDSESTRKQEGVAEEMETENGVYKNLSSYMLNTDLPTKPVMERILMRLIDKKHEVACLLVKNIFQHEYQLSMHLTLIRAIYLMEAGDIMHQFCTHIFQEADRHVVWANSYALTIQLEDCIELRYPEYSSRFSIVVEDKNHLSSVLDTMDEITLNYVVTWPLTLILSPTNMEYYNAVFQFLLKVKWALWALQQLRFSDLEEGKERCATSSKFAKKTNLLKFLRFWLLHSVGSVHTYLMGQVLHSLGLELEKGIEKAKDLDTLVQVHNSYVRMVYTHSLQPMTSNIIKTAILQLLGLSLNLHEIWQLGVHDIPEAKLNNMGEMYIKCHCFLGSVLQNTVESGQQPHLAGLCMALNSSTLPT